jgi:aminoglycoside 3-N-acetyltransferase
VAAHSLDDDRGEGSPLARVYDLDGQVLLLGVGHDNYTSLHLAEYRAAFPGRRWEGQGSPVLVDGVRRWVRYQNLVGDASDFERLGQDFAAETGLERRGPVGATRARGVQHRHRLVGVDHHPLDGQRVPRRQPGWLPRRTRCGWWSG